MHLRKIREERKMTMYQLMKKTGLSGSLIFDYENENKEPGLTNLIKLCKALECSPNELLNWKENNGVYTAKGVKLEQ
jgi:DNA-binding Xre family transcriptional regulator